MTDEPRFEFHSKLQALRAEILDIAATVIGAIPLATSVVLDGDLDLAQHLIRWDEEIDARSLNVEEQCVEILALQAPVASDLRLVLATNRIIAEVERSADLLVNICGSAMRIAGRVIDQSLRAGIQSMSDEAGALYRAAMDAFAAGDAEKAADLDHMDSRLDELHAQFIQRIFECNATETVDLQVAVQLAVVARFYERIGDHAVNIGERVQFMVSGWLPDHAEAVGEAIPPRSARA